MHTSELLDMSVDVDHGPARTTWLVTMSGPGRPGTMALFSGVLALAGLDMRWASVSRSARGSVSDTFEVETARTSLTRDAAAARLLSMLEEASSGQLDVPSEMARVRTAGPVCVSTLGIPVRVEFEIDSTITTGMHLSAGDRPGLLYDAVRSLSQLGLRARSVTVARGDGVATYTFRLVDARQSPPTDPELLDRVRRALEQTCR